MLNNEGLILIAHSDLRSLMALYTLMDDEGYFVAPCFSRGDLLKYVARYKPELIMTNNPLSHDEGGLLLDKIRERSPKTRIVLLPDALKTGSNGAPLEVGRSEDIAWIVKALAGSHPPVYLN